MLTCIACSKQKLNTGSLPERQDDEDDSAPTPSTKHAVKAITSQVQHVTFVFFFSFNY